jgi:beta-glucosidase
MPKELIFPKNFLWGASTSAYQIEGGTVCDWSEFEKSEARSQKLENDGKNIEDFVCGQACDSYNRFDEDLECVKKLNLGGYRMGIEWARIEPEEGKFKMEEIKHYRQILQKLKKNNIKVVLTLWHWTNPLWVRDQGGWTNKKTVDDFSRYVNLVVKELGDQVDFWVTLNEPMIHVLNGYLIKKFPPSCACPRKAIKAYKNLVSAHRRAYDLIHAQEPDAQVSITQIVNFIDPANKKNPLDCLVSKVYHYFTNEKFLRDIKDKLDYIGFDYYFHDRMVWYPPFRKNLNKEVNDMGWEIYPEGIYQAIKYLSKFKLPLYIMENGLPDADDDQRESFIVNHLKYIHQAIEEGMDVRGYFYWSLLDNFEWAAGWAPKFGLFEVDRKNNFKRIARPSVKVYSEICKNNKVILNS